MKYTIVLLLILVTLLIVEILMGIRFDAATITELLKNLNSELVGAIITVAIIGGLIKTDKKKIFRKINAGSTFRITQKTKFLLGRILYELKLFDDSRAGPNVKWDSYEFSKIDILNIANDHLKNGEVKKAFSELFNDLSQETEQKINYIKNDVILDICLSISDEFAHLQPYPDLKLRENFISDISFEFSTNANMRSAFAQLKTEDPKNSKYSLLPLVYPEKMENIIKKIVMYINKFEHGSINTIID